MQGFLSEAMHSFCMCVVIIQELERVVRERTRIDHEDCLLRSLLNVYCYYSS